MINLLRCEDRIKLVRRDESGKFEFLIVKFGGELLMSNGCGGGGVRGISSAF